MLFPSGKKEHSYIVSYSKLPHIMYSTNNTLHTYSRRCFITHFITIEPYEKKHRKENIKFATTPIPSCRFPRVEAIDIFFELDSCGIDVPAVCMWAKTWCNLSMGRLNFSYGMSSAQITKNQH